MSPAYLNFSVAEYFAPFQKKYFYANHRDVTGAAKTISNAVRTKMLVNRDKMGKCLIVVLKKKPVANINLNGKKQKKTIQRSEDKAVHFLMPIQNIT